MDLLNATNMQAGYTMGMQPDGRESLVVVVKGTFRIPENGGRPELADEQVPLVEADEYTGEPGLSAPIYESDYARYKPKCDVILNGSAYAPDGVPVKKVRVSLTVGSMAKSFNVIGNRFWHKRFGFPRISRPEPFTVMPITYDVAFGGTDHTHEKPSKHEAFMLNPIGVGFHANQQGKFFKGKPLPNTEEVGKPIKSPTGNYRPMAFSPVGRGWELRYKLAGTYDQDWIDNVFPFLPSDFQDAYYQSAPIDQQTDYLKGGEIVKLINLTPQGQTVFRLPETDVPIVFFLKKGGHHETQAAADTLVLEPDLGRFTITWRASLPLKRDMFEVPQVLVGKKSRAWWRARELGKTYYSSLNELIQANQAELEEETE
ncbi:DUF2169 domain-containing protein [uncultured Desulfobacter sp.]|uniref:DUF2169 family type VI secretion system accessory protein n=1 Tax=uncultured Desulfobacter sp. TaxID=240139 RepID=UPI0029C8DCE9|nr:DUF2169 domain-containing protein [uncultured Desulfobacter sp.]